MTSATAGRPLDGVRVLEVANMIAGPSAGAMMADLGATVVKVEPPTGDILRGGARYEFEPGAPDPWWHLDNRGKLGIAVDLGAPDGPGVVLRLAESCDVYLTNLTVERQARYGIGEESIHRVNPTCVFASISGYGAVGPAAHRLAYDMTAFFARGGVQGLIGAPGHEPPGFRPGQGDHTTALSVLSSILAALLLRARTGEGQTVEVALMHVAAWTVASDLSATLINGLVPPKRERELVPALVNRFRCGDDRWVALCMPGPRDFFGAFARALGHPEWVDDERFSSADARVENAAELNRVVDDVFASADRATWTARLDAAGLTWAPIQDLLDLIDDPQAHALGMFAEVEEGLRTVAAPFRIKDRDVAVRGPAPDLGEHTRSVLAGAGYDADEIDDLVARGVVVQS